MKKIILLVALYLLLFLGTGCQSQQIKDQVASLPPVVEDLQAQTAPESKKQEKDEVMISKKSTQVGTTLYRGSWFDLEYPQDFIAKPVTPTTVFNEQIYVQTDEAYFTSPDGNVEFFVYSPLSSGNPENYLNVASTEELVSEKTESIKESERPGQIGDRIVRWVTIKAKDGSYYRSFVSIKEQVGTGTDLHHLFGIKYHDNESYEKYREAYVAFKESLKQYAD